MVLHVMLHYESLWAINWLGMKTPTPVMGQWAHSVSEFSSNLLRLSPKKKAHYLLSDGFDEAVLREGKHKTFSAAWNGLFFPPHLVL